MPEPPEKLEPRRGDLQDRRVICLKGFLFLGLGILAVTLALILHPSWQLALLLAIATWAFCRSYFFAFYVIERWVDPGFRYSGLVDFVRYWLRRSKRR